MHSTSVSHPFLIFISYISHLYLCHISHIYLMHSTSVSHLILILHMRTSLIPHIYLIHSSRVSHLFPTRTHLLIMLTSFIRVLTPLKQFTVVSAPLVLAAREQLEINDHLGLTEQLTRSRSQPLTETKDSVCKRILTQRWKLVLETRFPPGPTAV